uniref:CTCK domain-containing protein n=1 Tax=Lates calcarifer TaxID=8187 RepID=A0A4W6CZ38_LATCA
IHSVIHFLYCLSIKGRRRGYILLLSVCTCRYSAAANKMMHQCECCREATTSQKQVELICANGSRVQHSYTVVDTCSCSKAECVLFMVLNTIFHSHNTLL